MRALASAADWAATPLGSIETWPESLSRVVAPLLASRLPFLILWGPRLLMVYNDAYTMLIGDKHPAALGSPAREVFAEIWETIGPMFDHVIRTGEATSSEDLLLTLKRRGFLEECYFTFSYSPIFDQAGVAGVLTSGVVETTRHVISQRRLELLRRLNERLAAIPGRTDAAGICAAAAEVIASDPLDAPFCLFYVLDRERQRAVRAGVAGLDGESSLAPPSLDLARDGAIWPLQRVISQRAPLILDLPKTATAPVSAWGAPLSSARLIPLDDGRGPGAVLIAGISAHVPLDDVVRSFWSSLGADLEAALTKERSYRDVELASERLAMAAEAAEFGAFDWDLNTDTGAVDSRFRRILGLGPAENMSNERFISMMLPPDEAAQHREKLKQALRDGALHTSSRIRRLDGAYRWIEIHGKTVSNAGGGRRMIGVIRDITAQKQNEERLHNSEQRYKTLVDAAADGILINRDDRVVFANRAFVQMIGARDHTELLGRDPFSFLHPDFHAQVRERIAHLLETGETNPPLEQRYIRLDGAPLEVEVVSTIYESDEGRGVQLLIRDITARKEAALTQTRLAAIVEFSEDAIVGKNLQGIIQSWNKGAEHIFGYTADEVIGHSVLLLIPPELAHQETEILDRISRGERLQNFETIRVRKSGERFPVSLTISPIRDEYGRVVGASKIARDITDRKRIEREHQELLERERAARAAAEEANRLKDEFLATLSHELRAPLSAISGWSHLLSSGSLADGDHARALDAIQRGVESQTQLINDLLDVSRVVAGKMRLDVRPIKLVDVIEQAVETVRPAAAAKRVRLQLLLDPKAGPLAGDSDRLQQVFWNLLSNALKFTPAGGRVEVRAERINSHVEITVSDTGAGISHEVLPFIFDRFRQGDAAINRRYGGLGLGLSIVRHLVELHGGSVTADSAGPGKGATFVVRLPVTAVSQPWPGGERVHPGVSGGAAYGAPELNGIRLLVVDDEPGTREVMLELLQRAGAEVRVAASAAEALEMLDEWPPDVLISDIGMPIMDGYALIRAIRTRPAARGGRVPAAALTAYSRTEDRLRALSAGYQIHLTKPVEPVELLTVIASLAQRL